jgi:hypothetical protein
MVGNSQQDNITRFNLRCYCPWCRQLVDVDLTVLGTPEPLFRNASLLCRSPQVQVDWTASGELFYIHRVCGGRLIPEEARPLLGSPAEESWSNHPDHERYVCTGEMLCLRLL